MILKEKKKMSKKTTKKSIPKKEEQGNTLIITRVIRAPIERVYKAFLDPEAMVKWFPPHGFTAKISEMDARVGGRYKMSFTNFSTGKSSSFGGTYLELKPHSLIKFNDKFDDPNMPGQMETTIELTNTIAGTLVKITQTGIPVQMPIEFATMGWQESIQLLEQLVTPEIPDM
jgi:uncharacterized protein YndB with AHSA1/START domain